MTFMDDAEMEIKEVLNIKKHYEYGKYVKVKVLTGEQEQKTLIFRTSPLQVDAISRPDSLKIVITIS